MISRISPALLRLTVLCVATLCLAAACSSSQRPDFGTLPRVEVALGSPSKKGEPEPEAQDREASSEATADQETSGVGGARGESLTSPTTSLRAGKRGMDLPDPPPLHSREHASYVLRFERGELSVDAVRLVSTPQPQPTARRLGRFAFELWRGPQLIDRVRFDFPLLGASVPNEEEPLESGLTATTRVLVPLTRDATQARLVDRKRRTTVDLSWPPPQAAVASSSRD